MKLSWRFNDWLPMPKRRHFLWDWADNETGVSQNAWSKNPQCETNNTFLEGRVSLLSWLSSGEPQGSFWFWAVLPWRKGCAIRIAHLLSMGLLDSPTKVAIKFPPQPPPPLWRPAHGPTIQEGQAVQVSPSPGNYQLSRVGMYFINGDPENPALSSLH